MLPPLNMVGDLSFIPEEDVAIFAPKMYQVLVINLLQRRHRRLLKAACNLRLHLFAMKRLERLINVFTLHRWAGERRARAHRWAAGEWAKDWVLEPVLAAGS